MTAKPGTEYAYRLVAVNDDTIGSFGSNVLDGRPFTKTPKPTGGMATWNQAGRTVNLTWNATPGAGGYFVRRKQANSPALQLGALVAPTTAFADPDARAGRTYIYQIFASDTAGGISDPLEVSITTTGETEVCPPVRMVLQPTPRIIQKKAQVRNLDQEPSRDQVRNQSRIPSNLPNRVRRPSGSPSCWKTTSSSMCSP
ncbi:MAG: hypothetical protein QM758_14635 [Armatimonas sp.]